jgi:hypothetical protein
MFFLSVFRLTLSRVWSPPQIHTHNYLCTRATQTSSLKRISDGNRAAKSNRCIVSPDFELINAYFISVETNVEFC